MATLPPLKCKLAILHYWIPDSYLQFEKSVNYGLFWPKKVLRAILWQKVVFLVCCANSYRKSKQCLPAQVHIVNFWYNLWLVKHFFFFDSFCHASHVCRNDFIKVTIEGVQDEENDSGKIVFEVLIFISRFEFWCHFIYAWFSVNCDLMDVILNILWSLSTLGLKTSPFLLA